MLAQWYDESRLKEANLHTVAVAELMAFNMSMKRSQQKNRHPSTANPAYWGFYILLRVRPNPPCTSCLYIMLRARPQPPDLSPARRLFRAVAGRALTRGWEGSDT